MEDVKNKTIPEMLKEHDLERISGGAVYTNNLTVAKCQTGPLYTCTTGFYATDATSIPEIHQNKCISCLRYAPNYQACFYMAMKYVQDGMPDPNGIFSLIGADIRTPT